MPSNRINIHGKTGVQQPITLQVLIKVVERIERLVSGLTESYRKNRINAWLRSAAQAAVGALQGPVKRWGTLQGAHEYEALLSGPPELLPNLGRSAYTII